jgi:endo-1,4-beta-xylanase
MKKLLLIVIFLSLVNTRCFAQIAAEKCKFLGNVIAGYSPSDFLAYWNQVTPENSGKWGSVEGTRNTMNWTSLDQAYKFAKDNNLPFKQHTFIWGNQQPSWIESLTAEEQLTEIEEWMKGYCDRYPETDFIDVVNEPLHDPPTGAGNGNYSAALGGNGTTGWDWVVKSFQLARQHCPNAKLILNDYNIINDNNKTLAYKNIISILKGKNLIDAIGVQGHRFELENTSNSTLQSNLNVLGDTGLPIYITEFDLGNLNNTGIPDDNKQLELYKRIFPLLWTHPSVYGITLWGYKEGETWMETAFLKKSGGTERPAFTWLKEYVSEAEGGLFCYTGTETEEKATRIYPNPVNHEKVSITSSSPMKTISLFDQQGRMVKQYWCDDSMTYDLEISESPGLYLLRVESKNKFFVKKLVIQ